MSIWPSQRIPTIDENESVHVRFPSGHYSHCNLESLEQTKFKIQEGPDIVLDINDQLMRLWDAPLNLSSDNVVFSLYNSNNESVLLRHETFGDAQWNLSSLPSSLPQGWTHFDVPVPSTERSTVQLIHQDGAIMLHFGGYLEA